MATEQLRPWESLPAVVCERCGQQATRRVAAGTATVERGAVLLGSDPLIASVLTCDDCETAALDEMCDRYDGAGGEPLRMSWQVWFFTRTWLGRPLDRLSAAWGNWRDERSLRRFKQCTHDWQPAEYGWDACKRCGWGRLPD